LWFLTVLSGSPDSGGGIRLAGTHFANAPSTADSPYHRPPNAHLGHATNRRVVILALTPNAERNALVAILVVAAGLRVIAATMIADQSVFLPDILAYRRSAQDLLQHGLIRDPYQMPLYPLLIAGTNAGIGQLATDIAISVLSVLLVYYLANALFDDQYSRLISAFGAACYPPLIFFSVVGLSENLFIVLVLAAFLSWYRARFTLAAIFATLAVLTRPIFDIFAPFLVFMFSSVVHRLSLKKSAGQLARYALVYCVMMTPWWAHNYKAYGQFVRLTPGGGTVLYAGNNPMNKTGGGNVGVDYDLSSFANITDPIERDRALRGAAIDYIFDHPQHFAQLAWLKFQRMWRFWPVNESYRSPGVILLSAIPYATVLLFAAFGLYRNWHVLRKMSPILLLTIFYTAMHMILVGTIRYRLPLEPFLIAFAGAGASCLVRHRAHNANT
jgi:hypothetical protein